MIQKRYVWEILALTLGSLIVWDYWIPLGLVTAPAFYMLGNADYFVFWNAGRLWLTHQNPYTINGSPSGFIYSPSSLPLYGLFALISDFRLSSILWFFLYLLVFAVAFLVLGRTVDSDRKRLYALATILLFITSYPVIGIIAIGQCDLLISSVAILALALQRMGHRSASAFTLSVATLLKGPAVLLLIYFVLFRRDIRYFAYFAVSTLSLLVASLLIIPVELYRYYLVEVLPMLSIAASQGRFDISNSSSVLKFLSIAGLSWVAPIGSMVGFVVFGVFSFWASSRRSLSISNRPVFVEGMFLMNVLVMLQFTVRTVVYTYVWVIFPLALCLSALLVEKINAWYTAVFGLTIFMLNCSEALRLYGLQSFPLVQAPFEIIGNVILTFALAVIYLKPSLAFNASDQVNAENLPR